MIISYDKQLDGLDKYGFTRSLHLLCPATSGLDLEEMLGSGGNVKVLFNNRYGKTVIEDIYTFEHGNNYDVWCRETSDQEYISNYQGCEKEIRDRIEEIRGDIEFDMGRLRDKLLYLPRENAEKHVHEFPELHELLTKIKDRYCDLADEEFALSEYLAVQAGDKSESPTE